MFHNFREKCCAILFSEKMVLYPKSCASIKPFFDFIRNVFVIIWMHRLLFYAEIFGLNSSIQGSKLIVYSYKWEKRIQMKDV